MSGPLIIRNLTSTRLAIKRVEQINDPKSAQSKASENILRPQDSTCVALPKPQSGEDTVSQHPDSHVILEPFESYSLSQPIAVVEDKASSLSTSIQLSLESSEGYRYRIDVNPSYTQRSIRSLTSVSPASASYTAIYHPSQPTAHLTVHSGCQVDYKRWMAAFPDALALSAISIPGTHNSHTHYRALPSVRCQIVDVKKQLENGIRFLDIRLQPVYATDTTKKDLYLVHGAFPVSLTGPKYFEPLLKICYDFLFTNPTETILISLKREGIGNATDHHLAQILQDHYIATNPSKWYKDTTIPQLGTIRGKLVLIRRYNSPSPIGLDATSWPNSPKHALFPQPGPTFCLQDFCDVLEPSLISKKIQYANEHLIRAAECVHHNHIPDQITRDTESSAALDHVPTSPLYLNFLSGSNFWRRACWPENIAKIVNRGMEEWLCTGHHLQHPEATPRQPGKLDGGGGGGDDSARDIMQDGDGVVLRRADVGDGGAGVVIMDCVGENGDWELVRLVVGMNMGVLMKVGKRLD